MARTPPGPALFAHDRSEGRLVGGCDEAGRGCLAGPLVIAAVSFDHQSLGAADLSAMERLDDSKRLSAARRRELFEVILRAAAGVAIMVAGPRTIDREGIHRVNLRLMAEALSALGPLDAALVDGFSLGDSAPRHRQIIKGDQTSAAIAAASVIAKTHRDRLMEALGAEHPAYGFERHAGYPTAQHRQAITEHGPLIAHRMSFRLTAAS